MSNVGLLFQKSKMLKVEVELVIELEDDRLCCVINLHSNESLCTRYSCSHIEMGVTSGGEGGGGAHFNCSDLDIYIATY